MPGPDEVNGNQFVGSGHEAPAAPDGAEKLPGLSDAELATLAEFEKGNAAPAAAMAQDKAEAVLDATLMQVVGIMLRGIMVSTGGLPPDVILRSFARVFARLIGESMAGDLAPVYRARATVKEAFLTTLRGLPVKPAPQPPGPTMPVRRI